MSFKRLSFDKYGAPMLDGERVPNVISYDVKRDFGRHGRNEIAILSLTLYVEPPKEESQEND